MDHIITIKDNVKDLGVWMSADRNFSYHIQKVISKVKQRIGWIQQSFRTKNPEFRKFMWRNYVSGLLGVLWTNVRCHHWSNISGVILQTQEEWCTVITGTDLTRSSCTLFKGDEKDTGSCMSGRYYRTLFPISGNLASDQELQPDMAGSVLSLDQIPPPLHKPNSSKKEVSV